MWGERARPTRCCAPLVNVLCEHTDVSSYVVDPRPFLFGVTCPAEEQGLARSLIQDATTSAAATASPTTRLAGGYLARALRPRPGRDRAGPTTTGTALGGPHGTALGGRTGQLLGGPHGTALGGRTGQLSAMTFQEGDPRGRALDPAILAAIDAQVARRRRPADRAVEAAAARSIFSPTPMTADGHATIHQSPGAAVQGPRRGSNSTSEVAEMTPQTMQRRAAGVDPNPTAAAELAADQTLDRITRAREDADTPDDAVAAHAWRRLSRLAGCLSSQARAIAGTLEGAPVDRRVRDDESLLAHPDPPTGPSAR